MKGGLFGVRTMFIFILLLGFIFRTYNFEKSFIFNHDQDLYSWIAKDILVNHHQRLVGQITSVDGVFIGSFYYYLMAVFFWLGNMNPMSAIVPLTIIGVIDIVSIYWIVKRHFGLKTGVIAASIFSVSFGIANFERWSVPTEPTFTWSIWFLGVILEMYKGNLKFLPLYGFLVGFVWQLHIALLPILPIPMLAYIIGGNGLKNLWIKDNLKFVGLGVGLLALTLSPFLLFEIKHNFSQVKSIVAATQKDMGGPTGIQKVEKVINASGKEFQSRLVFGWETEKVELFWIAWVIITAIIIWKKRLPYKIGILFGLWYFLTLLAQFSSKRVVSEYYFTNMIPIYVISLALFIDVLNLKTGLIILALYLGINIDWLKTKTDDNQSYFYKMGVINYVKQDSLANNYPCIAVNYIADPGVGVGFRYLFWKEGIRLVNPGTPEVPVYNIPIPWGISASENPTKFGRFGVLLPVYKGPVNKENCDKPEYQLEELLGYTK